MPFPVVAPADGKAETTGTGGASLAADSQAKR
jgi:hypothetical protein